MKVEIKGENLVITIPMNVPRVSSTGKTMIVATTGAPQLTDCIYKDGDTEHKLTVAVNAFFKHAK